MSIELTIAAIEHDLRSRRADFIPFKPIIRLTNFDFIHRDWRMTLTQKQISNLYDHALFLITHEFKEDEDFDMSKFGENDFGGTNIIPLRDVKGDIVKYTSCGSAGCSVGWATNSIRPLELLLVMDDLVRVESYSDFQKDVFGIVDSTISGDSKHGETWDYLFSSDWNNEDQNYSRPTQAGWRILHVLKNGVVSGEYGFTYKSLTWRQRRNLVEHFSLEPVLADFNG